MTLTEFNSKYKYKSDLEKYGKQDIWEIPILESDGFYYGDCESYCLFLKNNIEKFEEWDLYFCKINGIGHCILVNNNNIIDCNSKEIMLKDKYIEKYKITELKKYSKFIIFSKYVYAKLFLFFKGK